MRKEIRWTKTAVQDLDGIIPYIAENNPYNAEKIFKGIRKECENLANFERAGRIVPELKIQNIHIYRELLVIPWRIIYRVSENTVYILAIFDGRRDLQEVLLARILNY